MEMQRYYVARRIVAREGCDRGGTIRRPIESSILPLLRHPLSHYRMHAELTTGSVRAKFKLPEGV